ncbi:single-stranded DNA-binding protein [Nocardioides sp. SYSU DS0663]|uniref:single-stranded DNA-binding protein n=1 Tax=Nocardioides sp. SYSU DS0663 TaxID=3416445 RepID=UPI003F4C8F7D
MGAGAAECAHVNEVRLVGRVAAEAAEKVLPSGDVVVTARLVVERAPESRRSRQSVDTLDCAAWAARPRRSLIGWRPGDVVAVDGAMRRRFFRSGGGAASRVEIEVRSARVIQRAATG